MRKHMIGLGAAVGLATLSNAAQAATATSNFQVKLTIQAQCLAATTSDLDFLTSGFLSANIDKTMDMTVSCTSTTPYKIGLDAGLNGGSVTTRQMKGPNNDVINYSLYSDTGRTTNWGNTPGTDTVDDTGNGQAKTHTVFGRVPAQNTPRPGNYTDTVTVTVTY